LLLFFKKEGLPSFSRSPWGFALLAVVLYAILLVPLATSRRPDLSVFIMAGDTFANPATVSPPITVLHNSLGYDGQFFYRFALNPLSTDRTAHGITLDVPAKRMQRIVYPLLAWLVSLGRQTLVPASLLLVNLAGLGIIAATTAWLTRRHGLAWWLPIAITAWPGFLVALTHDTAEITTAALLLSAIACYMSNRLAAYCVLAAAAALTRETVLPVLLGVLAYEVYIFAIARLPARRLSRVVVCGLVFIPFAIWWRIVGLIWHQSPQSLGQTPDLGWPFAGVITMLVGTLTGTHALHAAPGAGLTTRGFALLTICGLIAFCVAVALRMPRLLRTGVAGLAIGWGLIAALMSLLTADGPLIEPLSYFRAFSECWVVGCLLLAQPPVAPVRRPMALAAILFAADVNLVIWKWSLWLINQ